MNTLATLRSSCRRLFPGLCMGSALWVLLALGSPAHSNSQSDACARSAAEAGAHAPQVEVRTLDGHWTDASRGHRSLPWRLYLQEGAAQALPLIVYSHGAGGALQGNEPLARALAAQGFAVMHLQHQGSDAEALRGGFARLRQVSYDPDHIATRVGDVEFALRALRREQGVVPGTSTRIEISRFGLAGHSLGALTALVGAGQVLRGHENLPALPGLVAVVAYSPGPPRPSIGGTSTAFAAMRVPILHVTGTRDAPPDRAFEAAARRVPFDTITKVDQMLLVLEGADHLSLAGNDKVRFRRRHGAQESLQRTIVQTISIAFWQHWLKAQPGALLALKHGLAGACAGVLTLETKPAVPS